MTASTEAGSGPARSSGASVGRVPDFFLVGHPKSGTSALYAMLRAHPQIFLPEVKEPSFFVPELRSRSGKAKHPDTLEAYLRLFAAARADQLAGEGTPSYLWWPAAAGRIAELCPQARIVAILREPAAFLRSLHLQLLRSNVETVGDLRRALALEPERREGRGLPANSTRPQLLRYSEHVQYVAQLRRFHDAFPSEQVLVLIYEDYRADNEATVRRVQRFLGVDDSRELVLHEVNPARRLRSPRLDAFVRSLYLGRTPGTRTLKSAVKRTTPQRVRRAAVAAQRRLQEAPPPPADDALMRELRVRFEPEVRALGEYLGRDLIELWGYDRLG